MKRKTQYYIVRCLRKGPKCGHGLVLLRSGFVAALKTAKDHAAQKRHDTGIYTVKGPIDTVTVQEVTEEGYRYVPTREYDYGDDSRYY